MLARGMRLLGLARGVRLLVLLMVIFVAREVFIGGVLGGEVDGCVAGFDREFGAFFEGFGRLFIVLGVVVVVFAGEDWAGHGGKAPAEVTALDIGNWVGGDGWAGGRQL